MLIHELTEAPLRDYEPLGDFSRTGGFRHAADRALVTSPVAIGKVQQFFSRTPYDFRIFPVQFTGGGRWLETGAVTPERLVEIVGMDNAQRILSGHNDDTITVVFTNNTGDRRLPLTPWIMAHRIGHAVQASGRRGAANRAWQEAEQHFFSRVNSILEDFYGKKSDNRYGVTPRTQRYDLDAEYNALFNAIGTQRSSRQGEIRRPYEFLYELFAQYLGTGHVTLKPLPQSQEYGRRAWGHAIQSLRQRSQPGREAQYETETLAHDMEILFGDVLSSLAGSILVM